MFVYHTATLAFEPTPGRVGTLQEHMLIVPVGLTINAFIPTPGGIGGGEAAYGELYRLLGRPFATGLLGSLAQRLVFWTLGIVGYVVYTRMKKVAPAAAVGAATALQPVVASGA